MLGLGKIEGTVTNTSTCTLNDSNIAFLDTTTALIVVEAYQYCEKQNAHRLHVR